MNGEILIGLKRYEWVLINDSSYYHFYYVSFSFSRYMEPAREGSRNRKCKKLHARVKKILKFYSIE